MDFQSCLPGSIINLQPKAVCRTCLRSELLVCSLFDSIKDFPDSPSVASILESLYNFETFPTDNYPGMICSNCLEILNRSYAFKIKCETANKILAEYFQKVLVEQDDDKRGIPALDSCIELETTPGIPITLGDYVIKELDEEEWNEHATDGVSLLVETLNNKEAYSPICSKSKNVAHIKPKHCDKQFRKDGPAKNTANLKSHPPISSLKCRQCDIMFQTVHILQEHNREVHGKTANFNCKECGAFFLDKVALMRHHSYHNKSRFKCCICRVVFRSRLDLIDHMDNLHKNIKLHNCPYCPMKYKKRVQLNIHIFEHTGQHRFTCDICQIPLWDRKHHTEHMRIHTGEKPFVCDVCFKSFRLKRVLDKHRSSIHGKKMTLRCEHCSFSTKVVDCLMDHISRRH